MGYSQQWNALYLIPLYVLEIIVAKPPSRTSHPINPELPNLPIELKDKLMGQLIRWVEKQEKKGKLHSTELRAIEHNARLALSTILEAAMRICLERNQVVEHIPHVTRDDKEMLRLLIKNLFDGHSKRMRRVFTNFDIDHKLADKLSEMITRQYCTEE